MASADPVLLVSDLHLVAERDEINRLFFRFLREDARAAQALYILGDLFDYWIGDDDLANPFHAQVAAAVRSLAESGCAVHLMHGNRDFLIGTAFAEACGANLLADPSRPDLFATPTLLLHGDTLCTGDTDYQAFRSRVRSVSWQREFLAKPLGERRAIALDLRRQSELNKQSKSAQIQDVTPDAVERAFARHRCRRMIHGHTHRPARHEHEVAGQPCERWVLSDWHDHGEYLRVDAAAIARVELR